MPELDPLELLGSWELSRVIVDRRADEQSSVEGRTDFAREDDGRIRWSESGTLRRGGTRVEVSRVLFLEPRESGWFVTFEDGRDFHPWAPGSEVEHPCAPDTYLGVVKVLATDRWSIEWQVSGSSKDYTMSSVLTRRGTTADSPVSAFGGR